MDLFLNSSRKEREDIPIGSRPSRNTCSKALVHTANSTRDDESKWMKNPQIQRLQAKGVSVARRKRQAETKAMAAKEGATGTVFVQLRSLELWQMFYRQETEMIITKAGRYVSLKLFHLESDKRIFGKMAGLDFQESKRLFSLPLPVLTMLAHY